MPNASTLKAKHMKRHDVEPIPPMEVYALLMEVLV